MPELLTALPTDTLDAVSQYLTGWDLFQLSHVNSQCLQHFSSPAYWNNRLSTPELNTKKSYVQARSFLCQGLKLQERLSRGGGSTGPEGALVVDSVTRQPFTEAFSDDSSFAMDIWFSLVDGEQEGVLTGGILLGGQSPLLQNCMWTNHHVAFMAVDADLNLFCSLLDDGANCVATKLDFGRWYHLALSFNRGQQLVYVDGQVVSELQGRLHHSWLELAQVQVGTGFVSSFWSQKASFRCDTRLRTVRTFCGWHNFHGVVNEFRIWRKCLNQEEIGALVACRDELVLDKPWYSLQSSMPPSKLKRVLCTRPSEHVVVVHKPSLPYWRLETTLAEYWHSLHCHLEWLPSLVASSRYDNND
ncbi:hypothetical protein DVH05_002582 [Phytophthora capsici]|nr:hypothetical protein DVH05_002582 [Phytophthora capsici]|eukprot:jgi/Phyca11/551539/estExt2_Genewise1Plus.C_PHYCAscaffold_420269